MWDIFKQTLFPLNSVVLLSWVLTWKARKICYHKFSSNMFISKNIASICNILFFASVGKQWRCWGRSNWNRVFRQAVSGRHENGEEKYFVDSRTQMYLSTSYETEQTFLPMPGVFQRTALLALRITDYVRFDQGMALSKIKSCDKEVIASPFVYLFWSGPGECLCLVLVNL